MRRMVRWVAILVAVVALPFFAFPRGIESSRLDGGRVGWRGLGYPGWVRANPNGARSCCRWRTGAVASFMTPLRVPDVPQQPSGWTPEGVNYT